MKVFATNYLEGTEKDSELFEKKEKWTWNPFQPVDKIIACGHPTSSEIITGKTNPDHHTDTDPAQEGYSSGMQVA